MLSKKGFKHLFYIFILTLIAFLSCSLDLFVPYPGIRVIYGSYFYKVSINLALIYLFIRYFNRNLSIIIFPTILVCYFSNLVSLYEIRYQNYVNQENIENLVLGMFKTTEPGVTMLLPPTNSIHFNSYDWQLEPNSTIQYKVFRHLHNRQKEFKYRFIGIDSLNFVPEDFPLVFPARSFIFSKQPIWESDEDSRSGLVYHFEEGRYGKAFLGPGCNMEPGKYRIDFYLQRNNECLENLEFGDFSIKASIDNKLLANTKLLCHDFTE